MRNSITRTIVTTTIMSAKIKLEKGVVTSVTNEPITVFGFVKKENLPKILIEKFGKTTQNVVTGTEVKETLYEISVEDFIKNATPVVKEVAEPVKEVAEPVKEVAEPVKEVTE